MFDGADGFLHTALRAVGGRESQEPPEDIFRELAIEKDRFPAEPIEGKWI